MNGIELTRAILYLKPGSEFVIHNEDYSTIQWKVLDGDAPTFAELETANQTIKLAEAKAKAEAQAKRQALLDKLGITEDEAKLLLGGN